MTPYYVLFALVGGFGLAAGVNAKLKKPALLAIMGTLFFFMAFRAASVGADTANYSTLFVVHGFSYGSIADVWASKGDITALYDSYAWVLYQLFPYQQAILICNSAIICLGVYLFIREFSETEVFSTLLYVFSFCYFFAFNGMRQSVAGSIVLLALVCMNRKKYAGEIALLVVALGIHQTSLFMYPVVAACHVLGKSERFNVTYVFLACLVISLGIRVFYEPLFGAFSGIFSRFDVYAAGGGPFSSADTTQGRQTFLYGVVGVFLLVSSRMPGMPKALAATEKTRTLWLIGSLCVGFGIFCTTYELLARIIYYLLPGLACVLGLVSTRLDIGNKTVLVRMGLLACYFLLCVYMLHANYSIVVPYHYFWE